MTDHITKDHTEPNRDVEAEQKLYESFCTSFGRLMHAYALVESELNIAIVDAASGRRRSMVILTLTGGLRMAPAKDAVKRLLRITKASKKRIALVDHLFAQLGEIQFFRDRLAHHTTVMSEKMAGFWTNMNFAAIREIERMEDIHFVPQAMDCAAADLHETRLYIGDIFNYVTRARPAVTPALPSWRYKPSMLSRVRLKSKQSRPKPRPRQKSSPLSDI